MLISDYHIGTIFETTCASRYVKEGCPFYDSFGISKEHTYMFARKPEEVRNVRLTIIEEDVLVNDLMRSPNYNENQVDYFGRIQFKEDGTLDIRMIYGNIKLYFMCFPYTPDAIRFHENDAPLDITTGKRAWLAGDRNGMSVRLKVEEI